MRAFSPAQPPCSRPAALMGGIQPTFILFEGHSYMDDAVATLSQGIIALLPPSVVTENNAVSGATLPTNRVLSQNSGNNMYNRVAAATTLYAAHADKLKICCFWIGANDSYTGTAAAIASVAEVARQHKAAGADYVICLGGLPFISNTISPAAWNGLLFINKETYVGDGSLCLDHVVNFYDDTALRDNLDETYWRVDHSHPNNTCSETVLAPRVAKAIKFAMGASPGVNAPTGLATTVNSDTQITLNWTDTNSGNARYHVERVLDGVTSYLGFTSLGATSYVDTSCETGTTYTYRIKAYDDYATSTYSSDVTGTTTGTTIHIWGHWRADSGVLNTSNAAAANGDTVKTWNSFGDDLLATALSQTTAGSQPTYRTGGINGKPYVDFNGSHLMQSVASLSTELDNIAFLIVAELPGGDQGCVISLNGCALFTDYSGTRILSVLSSQGSPITAFSGAYTAATTYLWSLTKPTGDVTGINLRQNGAAKTKSAPGTGTPVMVAGPLAVCGWAASLASWRTAAKVYEIYLLKRVPSTSDLAALETSVMATYGL